MQRQSIGGSPTRAHAAAGEVVPEEVKPEKPTRPSYAATTTTERSVHLIPLLTLLCLLVLYLSSHDPSVTATDVAGNGIVDSGSSRYIHGTLMAEGGATVNHRGLKADAKKPRLLHIRKLGVGSDKPQASAGET